MRIIRANTADKSVREIVYNALDTMMTYGLYDVWEKDAPEFARYAAAYEERMLGPVMTMMRRGIKVDLDRAQKYADSLRAEQSRLQSIFDDVCESVFGTRINPASPMQLQTMLYMFLGLPEQHKSFKGQVRVSTDASTLKKLQEEHPSARFLIKCLLSISACQDQLEVLEKKLTSDGRFVTSYNIAGTDTFRFSSSEHPLRLGSNIQNISPRLRHLFIADPGYLFFQADQQGAEARLVGYLSGDEAYIAACESSDIHTYVAASVFGFEPKRELAEREYANGRSYRFLAKRCAHGSNYYGKPRTIATMMGIETTLVERFQKNYFKAFPGIPRWHQHVARILHETSRLTNPWGLTRTFWGRRFDEATLRAGIAFLPQSTVAILTNVVSHRLWRELDGPGRPPMMLLANGHDAVIGQIREDLAEELIPRMLEMMRCPLVIEGADGKKRECVIPFDIEVGRNWGKYDAEKNPEGLKPWR